MATSKEYADFVCEQVTGLGAVRSKKMFGEYMVYIDDKPILLVCDNTVFIKMLDCVADLMENAEIAAPYD
ncbi:MAG: TfoX/Sxy family protein, partial [Oscillospiraceae bacterium]|nr:TfoX/Sxy family protein [Oscillospiraceae bacterium]